MANSTTLRIETVANSISLLDVEGLTIRDIDEVKVNPEKRLSVLMPESNFITDVEPEVRSFGGASAVWDIRYTLNYRLLYKPAGEGRTMTIEQLIGLTRLVSKVWDAFLGIGVLAGCEDVTIAGISDFGPVEAPNGDPWWGCVLSFRILEQIR